MTTLLSDQSIISFRLKVFWSVAKNLSFTQAAKELFISQPAVSKHIRELEQEKGLQFFNRNGRQISLTKVGERLYAYTEQILSIYNELEGELAGYRQSASQYLRIGAGTTMAQYLIPTLLSQFRRQHAQHQFSLLNGSSREIIEKVIQGELDLGIVETKRSGHHHILCYNPFVDEEVVAVINHRNSLKIPCSVDLDLLKKIPLLIRSKGSGTRDTLEKALADQELSLSSLSIRMEFESTESLKNYLLSDDSLGFLPVHAVRNELKLGQLSVVEVRELHTMRHYGFIYRCKGRSLLMDSFIKFSHAQTI